mmetsp:Transcript_8388/g.18410  ORF Transcript_8388/g.18410 Transcript_8388/m.18410 type:complete len:285 (-) Transcript_8388:601-1455(-)
MASQERETTRRLCPRKSAAALILPLWGSTSRTATRPSACPAVRIRLPDREKTRRCDCTCIATAGCEEGEGAGAGGAMGTRGRTSKWAARRSTCTRHWSECRPCVSVCVCACVCVCICPKPCPCACPCVCTIFCPCPCPIPCPCPCLCSPIPTVVLALVWPFMLPLTPFILVLEVLGVVLMVEVVGLFLPICANCAIIVSAKLSGETKSKNDIQSPWQNRGHMAPTAWYMDLWSSRSFLKVFTRARVISPLVSVCVWSSSQWRNQSPLELRMSGTGLSWGWWCWG